MGDPLSVRLRAGTREAHRQAEGTPFIRQFFAGLLTRQAYREFLVQLLHIYTALEEGHERHREQRLLAGLYYPELFRREALLDDLHFYFGDQGWEYTPLRQATRAYARRIRELTEGWSEGLVAHHYTRYLGDLSGGQALKRIVARTFGLDSSAGLAFYEFPLIPDHARFKEAYRAQLDRMPVNEAAAQDIVAEANRAFALNRELFDAMLETVA